MFHVQFMTCNLLPTKKDNSNEAESIKTDPEQTISPQPVSETGTRLNSVLEATGEQQ